MLMMMLLHLHLILNVNDDDDWTEYFLHSGVLLGPESREK